MWTLNMKLVFFVLFKTYLSRWPKTRQIDSQSHASSEGAQMKHM